MEDGSNTIAMADAGPNSDMSKPVFDRPAGSVRCAGAADRSAPFWLSNATTKPKSIAESGAGSAAAPSARTSCQRTTPRVTVQSCWGGVIASAARQSRWRPGVLQGRRCCYDIEIATAQVPRNDNLLNSEPLPPRPRVAGSAITRRLRRGAWPDQAVQSAPTPSEAATFSRNSRKFTGFTTNPCAPLSSARLAFSSFP